LSVQVGVGSTTVTVSIPTNAGSSASNFAGGKTPANPLSIYVLFTTILAFAVPFGRRRIQRFACISALLGVITACGGSSSSQGGGEQGTPPTSPGTYYITVNADSGTAQTSYLLTLTVN